MRFSRANDVTARGFSHRKHSGGVSHCARRLRAAAIDAEKDRHGLVVAQGLLVRSSRLVTKVMHTLVVVFLVHGH